MREKLEEIANAAEALHYKTRYRNYLDKKSLQEVQTIVKSIQATLDQITIEQIRLEQDDDAYDRQEAYPITNEPWD